MTAHGASDFRREVQIEKNSSTKPHVAHPSDLPVMSGIAAQEGSIFWSRDLQLASGEDDDEPKLRWNCHSEIIQRREC